MVGIIRVDQVILILFRVQVMIHELIMRNIIQSSPNKSGGLGKVTGDANHAEVKFLFL